MYGLRGHEGRLYGGLGVFNPPAEPAYRDPGYPPDPAIVAANNALNTAYQIAMEGAQAQNNLDQCRQNAENANSPQQYAEVMARCAQQYQIQTPDVPASSTSPVFTSPVIRGGQLTFTASRGGGFLQVGDTWLISITGASPNAPVTVSGLAKGAAFSNTPMGKTDSNGNWSKSGSAGPGEIGTWLEQWYVGGVYSGSVSFTVAAAPSGPTGGVPAAGSAPAGGGAPAKVPDSEGFSFARSFNCSDPTTCWAGFPKWAVLVAAAGVGLFMFGGGRGQ